MSTETGLAAVRAAAMSSTSVPAAGIAPAAALAAAAPDASAQPKMIGMPETEYQANMARANADGRADGAKAASARIKSIMTAPEAKGRETLAQSIAFDTELSHDQAVSMLKASPEAAKQSRLDGLVPQPKVDAGEPGTSAESASADLAAATQRLVQRKFGATAA